MNISENPSYSFNIFNALELAKIYSGTQIKLQVNSNINHYDRIINLFEKNQIHFESFTALVGKHKRFNIYFGSQTDFQDLFIIVAILKNFGLQSIFYSGEKGNQVLVGSYNSEFGPEKDISEGISSEDFLSLPFMLSISEFIQNFFKLEKVDGFSNNELISEDDSVLNDKEYEEGNNDYFDYDEYNECESYSQYAGSYAQDVEGLSDDFIDDVLGGEPDAYWNID